ncbi:hypothetical protein BJG93_36415 (plasmid) [Paraburkholderia sprentiae WSM5005]|uniref:Cytochrome c domain-containing protein n=1 Tax=Paraburkholderia sprentiae WSM5005 TaxID=754502 RepID=A0A8F4QJ10_9BURK|nr:hypothetical protein [Paraburkholderia sprentiae]QXE07350.1 hypothetical protein BJG93_36415 [Paraburkholderia sprentiae WSM5005]
MRARASRWSGLFPFEIDFIQLFPPVDNRTLPDNAVRCINCHGHADNAASFAPPLTSQYLLSDTRRRGGPPSRYDLGSFCRVVNVGVDPTGIELKKAMPQYTFSDTECAALWSFVTAR